MEDLTPSYVSDGMGGFTVGAWPDGGSGSTVAPFTTVTETFRADVAVDAGEVVMLRVVADFSCGEEVGPGENDLEAVISNVTVTAP